MVSDDRGQVLLVGAVALAFILVGLGVLLGSVADTSASVSPGESVGSADRAAQFNYVARRGVRGTVLRVNHASNETTFSQLNASIADAIGNYSDALARSYSDDGIYVDVTYAGAAKNGTRIVQDDIGEPFDSPIVDDEDWTVVNGTDLIGWATLNVNVSSMPENGTTPLVVNVTSGSEFLRYEIVRNGTGVDVTVENESVSLGTVTCDAFRRRAVLSLLGGGSPYASCTFPSLRRLEGPYDITFENGDVATGKYSFVVRDEESVIDEIGGCNAVTSSPCTNPVVWTASIETTYVATGSSNITYTNVQNVTIYNAAGEIGAGAFYTVSGDDLVAYDDGSVETVSSTATPAALGPARMDLTGDGRTDVPYVTDDGKLKITNSTGGTTVLVDEDNHGFDIATSKTRLAVGTWNGSAPSVFFVDDNNDQIYRVDGDGTVVEVADPSNGAQAVVGTGDVDGDGDEELIFADSSQQLRYVDDDGTTIEKIENGQTGSNNGIGSGSMADFDDDGVVSVVTVDGSNDIKIVGEQVSEGGEGTTTISAADAAKAPVTAADVDGDSEQEIVYVGKANGNLKYVDDVLGTPEIEFLQDSDGNKIPGSDATGVV